MEMFLFVVYAVSVLVTGVALSTVGADKLRSGVELGLEEGSRDQGYDTLSEMPHRVVTVSRVISWVAILTLPVIPVVNTVLTLRLGRKVYRRMTAR